MFNFKNYLYLLTLSTTTTTAKKIERQMVFLFCLCCVNVKKENKQTIKKNDGRMVVKLLSKRRIEYLHLTKKKFNLNVY